MGKRAVFVFRNLGTGGAQKIEAFVANALCNSGYDVIAINMASSKCTVNLDNRIKVVNVTYDFVELCHNKIQRLYNKLIYLYKLRKAILAQKPDVVCAFLSDVVRITVLALKGTAIPIIGSERGDPNVFSSKQFHAYRKAYIHCKYAVFQLDNVMQMYNLPDFVNQKVIPNPCIPRTSNKSDKTSEPSEHIILSAGRLAEQKRFDLLIDAFNLVYQKHPEYQLHIYGSGPLEAKLYNQIQSTSASSSIRLAGDVEDVFAVASNSDFFVLSSDFEGVPNVILEAMYAGIPVIATDCSPGGASYLLENGECGIIVPKNDKLKLAEAINNYIECPSLREQHIIKSLKSIKKYEPHKIEKMWIDIFNSVLEES